MTQDTDSEYRAILTPRESEIISGETDVSDNYRYRVISRVREKIEVLGCDLEILDDHHSDLANELREVVCGEE